MVDHTPTPWEASERGDYSDLDGNSRVILGDDRRIATVLHHGSAEDEANTCLIVQSVNAFAALAKHLGCKPEDLNVDLVALVKAAQNAEWWLMSRAKRSEIERSLVLELNEALATLPHDTVDRADKE